MRVLGVLAKSAGGDWLGASLCRRRGWLRSSAFLVGGVKHGAARHDAEQAGADQEAREHEQPQQRAEQ